MCCIQVIGMRPNESMTLQMFHPFAQLAAALLHPSADDEDGAHDLSHIVRVWRNAKLIQREDGGDLEILAAAVLLHDCVQVSRILLYAVSCIPIGNRQNRPRTCSMTTRKFCGA